MGMLNVSPIGRNCSQEERDEFERYDKVTALEMLRIYLGLGNVDSHLQFALSLKPVNVDRFGSFVGPDVFNDLCYVVCRYTM